MKRQISLRARLLAGVLGATLLAWLAVAVAGYFQSRHELDELLDAHLAQSAAILVSQLSEESGEMELEHAPQFHHYARKVAFQIWEHGSRLRLHSVSAPSNRLSSQEQGFSYGEADGKRWRVYSTWDHDGDALVQVAERVDARAELSGEIARHLLLPMVVALPLLGLALALAIGKGLKPLNDLAHEVAVRGSHRLQSIDAEPAPREVRPLVEQLNALFERIEQSLENERRFTADASHELRTPIAAIRAQAQVARETTNEAERRHALESVLAGCDRATRLAEQLLTLARLEAGNWCAPDRFVDLAQAAHSVLAELGQAACSKGITLELVATAPVAVNGDLTLLQVLIRNLVDNGIRYSSSGGTVTVRVDGSAVGARLQVIDQGPGIAEAERERVLKRFYRSVGVEATGSGLGLSIVTRIAALHGAVLSLEDGENRQGLKVTVEFPNRTTG